MHEHQPALGTVQFSLALRKARCSLIVVKISAVKPPVSLALRNREALSDTSFCVVNFLLSSTNCSSLQLALFPPDVVKLPFSSPEISHAM